MSMFLNIPRRIENTEKVSNTSPSPCLGWPAFYLCRLRYADIGITFFISPGHHQPLGGVGNDMLPFVVELAEVPYKVGLAQGQVTLGGFFCF